MATFHPNPNQEHEPWIEKTAIEGFVFRIWHVMFICFSALVAIVILICCCMKIRIPRTKQEIEANYRRKKLVGKFRERIRMIQNQEMDAIDLKRAMEIIQDDYKTEAQIIEDFNYGCDVTTNLKAEPQHPGRLKKIMCLIKFNKVKKDSENHNNITP